MNSNYANKRTDDHVDKKLGLGSARGSSRLVNIY